MAAKASTSMRYALAAALLLALLPMPAASAAVRRPDLQTPSVSGPSTITVGGTITASAAVKNVGPVTAGRSSIAYYLTPNGSTRGRVRVGERSIRALKARAKYTGTKKLTLSTKIGAGVYRLSACADARSKVKESNERNNCRTARRKLTVSPADLPPVAPPITPPAGPAEPAPPGPAPVSDTDGDGYPDSADCGPNDATVHPGAADKPDLALVDANCDGIDGDAARAVFVSPYGDDANMGTAAQPVKTLGAGMQAAAPLGYDLYVAAGTYETGTGVEPNTHSAIYGAYNPRDWSRSTTNLTEISGSPQAVLADGRQGLTLQLVTLASTADAAGRSAYGVRAINGSSVRLERVRVEPGPGIAGPTAATGGSGSPGGRGGDGHDGSIDTDSGGEGGLGAGWGSNRGGDGGRGGYSQNNGDGGAPGSGGVLGGSGGGWGDPGGRGSNGSTGATGTTGTHGAAASATPGGTTSWIGGFGGWGSTGAWGAGGSGGGGGGGQSCFWCDDGRGNGGGGGGQGGGPGGGGQGGRPGGGSFAIFLFNSTVSVDSTSSLSSGAGARGGPGGASGFGGSGGAGGTGATAGTSEIGAGGNGGWGGWGGAGGTGGGGAGGPSIVIYSGGTTSTVTVEDGATLTPGCAGRGGTAPNAGANGFAGARYPGTPTGCAA